MSSNRSLLSYLRGVALTAPFVAYLSLADAVLSLLLPLKPLAPGVVYEASSSIAWSVWAWIQLIFMRFDGARIFVSGDDLPAGRCRYFAKKQFRLVPFLGWGLWAMGMPMVSRDWVKDRSELDRVFARMVQGRFPTLVRASKYDQSLAWCKETGHPQPQQHLLYPRTKGFITTVQRLRKALHVKAVYDFTIAYQQGSEFQAAPPPPPMWDTLSLPRLSDRLGYKFHVHARRFPMATLPEKDEDLPTWLEQR
ncbi:hypothetical protein ACO1O0_000289 [Amphichorda felina]